MSVETDKQGSGDSVHGASRVRTCVNACVPGVRGERAVSPVIGVVILVAVVVVLGAIVSAFAFSTTGLLDEDEVDAINDPDELDSPSGDGDSTSTSTAPTSGELQGAFNDMEGSGTEEDPYMVTDVVELQAMKLEPRVEYELGDDIDASGTESWNGGAGFEPVGDFGNEFTGSLSAAGAGYEITGLHIDRSNEHEVGLIGVNQGVVEVSVTNADVTGDGFGVGTVVGFNEGDVDSEVSSSTVTGQDDTGGVVGVNEYGDVDTDGVVTDVDVDAESGYEGDIIGYDYEEDGPVNAD